jgi:alkanesulfonate monooxygenase SsuD/methylene tetrahydromethanopterin reductase-like flavin-dependent oxidoreductase (luciferase family)
MPSLLVLAAAIAQATTRIQIGTAVLLAPLHDPLRVAEDAATIALLSDGRFTLGLGAGWRNEEFEVFGVDQGERAGRIRETVQVLRGAWGPGAFSFNGDHYSFQDLNVTPKPEQPIPIWLGGFAPGAIRRAGRIADGFLGSSTGTSGLAAFAEAKQIALEGRTKAGGEVSTFAFALHVPVYVSSGRDPWEEIKPHYSYLRWKYADMGQARGSAQATSPPPLSAEREAQLRSTIICGDAEQVASEVAAFRDELGDDTHFIFRSDFPGLPSDQQFALIERIGSEVIPRLS